MEKVKHLIDTCLASFLRDTLPEEIYGENEIDLVYNSLLIEVKEKVKKIADTRLKDVVLKINIPQAIALNHWFLKVQVLSPAYIAMIDRVISNNDQAIKNCLYPSIKKKAELEERQPKTTSTREIWP